MESYRSVNFMVQDQWIIDENVLIFSKGSRLSSENDFERTDITSLVPKLISKTANMLAWRPPRKVLNYNSSDGEFSKSQSNSKKTNKFSIAKFEWSHHRTCFSPGTIEFIFIVHNPNPLRDGMITGPQLGPTKWTSITQPLWPIHENGVSKKKKFSYL